MGGWVVLKEEEGGGGRRVWASVEAWGKEGQGQTYPPLASQKTWIRGMLSAAREMAGGMGRRSLL